MIIRKVAGLWIVQRKHNHQIIFSHKNRMTCYEWIFKSVNYAQSSKYNTRINSVELGNLNNNSNSNDTKFL